MRTMCNRYNPDGLIKLALIHLGKRKWISSITYAKRWQVTVVDERGRHYDHYFVAKPTRKQIRKLHKVKHICMKKHCYECGKRIRIDQAFTWDELNYVHAACMFGAKK